MVVRGRHEEQIHRLGDLEPVPRHQRPPECCDPTVVGHVAQVIEESYAFQAKVLEANKSFAVRLLDTASPAAEPAKTAKNTKTAK